MTVHPPDLMPDLLTEAEAASLLHVSERTLRTIRAQGKIRHYVASAPMRRWLSTLMVAAVIVYVAWSGKAWALGVVGNIFGNFKSSEVPCSSISRTERGKCEVAFTILETEGVIVDRAENHKIHRQYVAVERVGANANRLFGSAIIRRDALKPLGFTEIPFSKVFSPPGYYPFYSNRRSTGVENVNPHFAFCERAGVGISFMDRGLAAFRSQLQIELPLSNLSGPMSGLKSRIDQHNTHNANAQPDGRDKPHDRSPSRHGLLGLQVALAALVFTGGLYCLANAIGSSRRRSVEAVTRDIVIGAFGVVSGGVIGLYLATSTAS